MRIAHLSDLHLLDGERHGYGVRFVSLGRPLDAAERKRKAVRAIAAARDAGAEHFVFSGDLTETGTAAQFEALAVMLFEAGLRGDEVTLVPGNHDAYTSPHEWTRALAGPLRPFAETSSGALGKVVEREDAFILPIDDTFYQPITRSAGRVSDELALAIEHRLRDPALSKKPIVLVVHHPLQRRPGPWHWVDGLLGCERLVHAVAHHDHMTILHGHLHRAVGNMHGVARAIGAAAIVDDAQPILHDTALRLDLVA